MNHPTTRLRTHMLEHSLNAVLFNTSEFLPSANLKYLSGFTGSDAAVLITRDALHLFTDGRYRIQSRTEAIGFQVHVVQRKLDAICRIIKAAGVRRLGIEGKRLSYYFASVLTRKIPAVEPVQLSERFLEEFRIRKRPDEAAIIRSAADIASRACRDVLDMGVAGKSERHLAGALESMFRRYGADGTAFSTIVASGERGALPHGTATDKVIRSGELVVIDYGCTLNGYNSDETVTCVVGTPSLQQTTVHGAVYEAHMRAVDAVRVGLSVTELDAVARRSIGESGFGAFFVHGLGHGVGLEVHEAPRISHLGRGLLEEGMVFTIEPGVYVEGFGGVRLESLVYLGAHGTEILSGMSKKLISVD